MMVLTVVLVLMRIRQLTQVKDIFTLFLIAFPYRLEWISHQFGLRINCRHFTFHNFDRFLLLNKNFWNLLYQIFFYHINNSKLAVDTAKNSGSAYCLCVSIDWFSGPFHLKWWYCWTIVNKFFIFNDLSKLVGIDRNFI